MVRGKGKEGNKVVEMREVEKDRAKGNLVPVIVFISAVGGDRRESRRGDDTRYARKPIITATQSLINPEISEP